MTKLVFSRYSVLLILVASLCVGCPKTQPPTVGFTADGRFGEAPLNVTFGVAISDATIVPTSWNWDFGDGTTSTEATPVHAYATPGLYSVSLTTTAPGKRKPQTYSVVRTNCIIALGTDRDEGTVLGETRTFQGIGFTWIPAGEFSMGTENDTYWDSDARPAHPVAITRGFWLSTSEVTQAQWANITGSSPAFFLNPDIDPDLLTPVPVEQVSWDDCQAFCSTLNALDDGGLYRLPTEAEWEYACRAGTTTTYWSGNDVYEEGNELYQHAWYWDNARYRTMSVRVAAHANPWGLFDMNGNVFEWCQDYYDDAGTDTDDGYYQLCYQESQTTGQPKADPIGPDQGFRYVVRGGAWNSPPHVISSASRMGYISNTRYNTIGFRLVRQ